MGDVVVSICDSPVQEKEHSLIKAEILRGGNELDFVVIKYVESVVNRTYCKILRNHSNFNKATKYLKPYFQLLQFAYY